MMLEKIALTFLTLGAVVVSEGDDTGELPGRAFAQHHTRALS